MTNTEKKELLQKNFKDAVEESLNYKSPIEMLELMINLTNRLTEDNSDETLEAIELYYRKGSKTLRLMLFPEEIDDLNVTD